MESKKAEEIMSKHFKECFDTHNEKISEKYRLYFHKAMLEYSKQEMEKAVSEFKERLIKAITSKVIFDDGYDSILSVQNIIEKLK
jgi:hypothetical protein